MNDVQKAIAAVKANPPDDGSPLPWHAVKAHVLDCACDDTADCESPLDAAHIAAAVNAAPVLLARIADLEAQFEAARVAVELWPALKWHVAYCASLERSLAKPVQQCNCGADAANAARTELRRALGLEVSP